MITQSRINRNVLAKESSLYFISNNPVVVIDFFIWIAPIIVGAVVTSPENGINFLGWWDVAKHVL